MNCVSRITGSLDDVSVRLPMDSPVFARLAGAIQHPSSNKEWCVERSFSTLVASLTSFPLTRFSMAEQAVNTIYALGDQPDALCSAVLRDMTMRVFGPQAPNGDAAEDIEKEDAMSVDDEEKEDADEEDTPIAAPTVAGSVAGDVEDDEATPTPSSGADKLPTTGAAFSLSQLIFVAGHCAIKQLVHLELVERDIKRRKAEEDKKAGAAGKAAGQDELDQVAGSVEDEIGDVIAATKERELLYGPESLLAVFGPMAAMIVSQPKVYNVSGSALPRSYIRAQCSSLIFSPPLAEPDAQDGRNARSQQVHVRERSVLRGASHDAL
jgi:condensin complex subunit 1